MHNGGGNQNRDLQYNSNSLETNAVIYVSIIPHTHYLIRGLPALFLFFLGLLR